MIILTTLKQEPFHTKQYLKLSEHIFQLIVKECLVSDY